MRISLGQEVGTKPDVLSGMTQFKCGREQVESLHRPSHNWIFIKP